MSLIKIVILKAFPYLDRIIKTRDDAISENAQLKFRIIALEKLVEGNANYVQAATLNPASTNNCLDDFSVTVFDRKAIPGKKATDI